MTLLEDIQQSAVDTKTDLSTLLRQCKLLGARLGSDALGDWIIWESNGYPKDITLPDYRIWPLELKGYFAGPFGSFIKNAPIPRVALPPETRQLYVNYQCRQSIASIEALLKNDSDGDLRVSTGDLSVLLGQKVYQGYNCVQAWAECSSGHLVEVLNAVRNRVLDFALAVWKESPTAGEIGSVPGNNLGAERVTQIFNTAIYGGSANLIGMSNAPSIAVGVVANDLSSLRHALDKKGLTAEDLAELEEALKADPTPSDTKHYGPKLSTWMGRMIAKAAKGTWEIGVGAAGDFLAQVIAKYYGL